jgi:ABC-type Na+ transport system ATPase subunit NatA
MDETVVIKASDLGQNINRFEAVADVSFLVERGEIFRLLGSNDTGKTFAFHPLAGQIDPNAMSACSAGCDVVKDHQRLKAVIGVVHASQNPGSAGRNLLYTGIIF